MDAGHLVSEIYQPGLYTYNNKKFGNKNREIDQTYIILYFFLWGIYTLVYIEIYKSDRFEK